MPRYWDLACATFRGPLLGEQVGWALQVRRAMLGPAPEPSAVEALNLAVGARALQSTLGGLALQAGGLSRGGSVQRRLAAVRALLSRLELVD